MERLGVADDLKYLEIKDKVFKRYQAQINDKKAVRDVPVTQANIRDVKVSLVSNIFALVHGEVNEYVAVFKLMPPFVFESDLDEDSIESLFHDIRESQEAKGDKIPLHFWLLKEIEAEYLAAVQDVPSKKEEVKLEEDATKPATNYKATPTKAVALEDEVANQL
jgi:hypothetical protein